MAALLIVVLSLLVGAGQMKMKTWVQTADCHRLLKRESVTRLWLPCSFGTGDCPSPTSVFFTLFWMLIFPHVWVFKMESTPLRIVLLPFSILEFQKNSRFHFLSKLKRQEKPLPSLIPSSYYLDPICRGSQKLVQEVSAKAFLKCLLFHISAALVSHRKSTNKFILCSYFLNQMGRLIFLSGRKWISELEYPGALK